MTRTPCASERQALTKKIERQVSRGESLCRVLALAYTSR